MATSLIGRYFHVFQSEGRWHLASGDETGSMLIFDLGPAPYEPAIRAANKRG
jgi:hypothetical protein